MGLFVLDTSKEQSVKTKIETAIQNINLHKEHFGSSYIIDDFALVYLAQALDLLGKEDLK